MNRVQEDFCNRKLELDEYFNFLSKLDKDNPTLHFAEMGISQTHPIDTELLKILKANGFLLIYNLLESFCRNFIIEILTAIQEENLTFETLSDETQKVWIAPKVKNYKDPNTTAETIEDCFHGIATEIINTTLIEFSEVIRKIETDEKYDAFGLSGSITKGKIRLLAKMYGFRAITQPAEEIAGDSLEDIKLFRNQLAHGRITFKYCGGTKSVIQMIEYKNNTIKYLEGVLVNIQDYLDNTRFKKS
jgi:MAE_28990/MAE_18760-like HEPN